MHYLGQSRDDVRILSIGTTTTAFSLSHKTGRDLGSYQWLSNGRLFSTAMSAQQQLVDFMLGHQLKGRYLRIDAVQSREQEADLGLDVSTRAASRTIAGIAEGAYQKVASNPVLREFLEHRAPQAVFYNQSRSRL